MIVELESREGERGARRQRDAAEIELRYIYSLLSGQRNLGAAKLKTKVTVNLPSMEDVQNSAKCRVRN